MLVPTLTAVVYAEWQTLGGIIASMGACLLVGAVFLMGKVKNNAVYADYRAVLEFLNSQNIGIFRVEVFYG